jgi:hypothetical protein
VDNGAPEGNPEEKPKTVAWKSGWRIEPDVVISIPAPYKVAAKGSGEIKSFLVPNPFREDTWVSSIEVRPGNPSVVHHVMVQVPEDTPAPSFSWGAAAAPCFVSPVGAQQDFNESLPIPLPSNLPVPGLLNRGPQPNAPKPPRNFAILEAVYAPGTPPMDFSLYDSAKLIPGGGNLRIEVHYTPNGKETTDQTSVGFKLAKEPPQHAYPARRCELGNPGRTRVWKGRAARMAYAAYAPARKGYVVQPGIERQDRNRARCKVQLQLAAGL